MVIHEDLDYLYRKLDYALWQKEAASNKETPTYQEATRMIAYYKRRIQSLRKKKKMIRQLTLF